MNKSLKLALYGMIAAIGLSFCIPSVRTWASQEGSYIYHAIYVNGPAVIYTGNTWKGSDGKTYQGLVVSTTTFSSTGVYTYAALNQVFLGGMTTAARPACAAGTEGEHIYDTTVHSLAFCDGTNWHKLVTGSGANDSWTSY